MNPPIVFALDFPSLDEARRAAVSVRDAIGMIKVGLELFVQAGPAAVALGGDVGLPVFLDLKLCDIPETVERAVGHASALGARILTVHAGGGSAMLARAVERAAKEGSGLEICAVTVLTSLDDADLASLGVVDGALSHAVRLAKLAYAAGVRAFVCSPHEVLRMRAELGHSVTLITPGVRLGNADRADQKRVATPGRAVLDGADWVVVGRPIRDATDRLAAARAIAADIDRAKGEKSR